MTDIIRVARRTVVVMSFITAFIGGILLALFGLVKLVEWLDKLTGWGDIGVAAMTAFLVLLFCSFMVAISEDDNNHH